MKTRSKKLEEVLFGKCVLNGGLPVVGDMRYPMKEGGDFVFKWDGNRGLIFELLKIVEELEKKVEKLQTKKK